MKTTFIYALCEPGTRTVRYIGKTVSPKRRFRKHVQESVKFDSHLGHWLKLLASRDALPEMIILRKVEGDGSDAEKRFIRLARGCQMRLVNATDGGDGCQNPSSETRKKMGDRQRGEKNTNFGGPLSPGHKAAISATKMGVRLTPAHCAAMSASRIGKPLSPAQLAAAVKKRGFKHTDTTKAKMSDAQSGEKNGFFGGTHSKETRELLRVARLGKKNTPEQNAAIGAALLGKKRGPYNTKRKLQIEWALAPYTLTD